jgi:hypothetical protein
MHGIRIQDAPSRIEADTGRVLHVKCEGRCAPPLKFEGQRATPDPYIKRTVAC